MTSRTLELSAFSQPMTASTFPNTTDPLSPISSSARSTVLWVDVFLPDVPIPPDFEDIDTIVTRHETSPDRRRHLQAARKALADREPELVTGLAAFRLRKGWSQKRLSEEVGTSQSYIARLESGNEDILMSTARRLASALGISLEEVDAALRSRRSGK